MKQRKVHTSHRFEKDAALSIRRGKDATKLRTVIALLISDQPLPDELKDHPLKDPWKGYRDLHIEPDWVLVYKQDQENLWLVRSGTHSDVFG
jgi:mRNA interferase YafQ